MRFLIVTVAIFACAAAAPSGALLAYNGLSHASLALAPVAVARAAPVAVPTIPPGDLQGAAIDAHVEASDHARAAVDAINQVHDQASELQGRAINAAQDHAWQAVEAAQTAQAQVDGAAASAAPVIARQVAGSGVVAYAAPAVAAYSAPAVAAYSAPAVAAYSAPAVAAYSAPAVAAYSAPAVAAYSAPAVAAYSAPAVAAYSAPAVAAYSAPAVAAYSAPAVAAYSAPAVAAYSAPAVAAYSAPAVISGSQSISSQSLSQSHPAPVHAVSYAAHGLAHAW